jgi:epoxide hydrolase-like predicted phosphatase
VTGPDAPAGGPVKAVLFDYSGVFTTPPFATVARYEEEHGLPDGTLMPLFWGDYGNVEENHPWHRLERGEITLPEFWTGLSERTRAALGDDFDASVYLHVLRDGFAVNWMMVEQARSLRGRYLTALLTNNVREFGDGWRGTIPVDELFDHVIDSCEVGSRKPEPRFFATALEIIGVAASEAVFLDDMAPNVAGAQAAGITAIHVTSVPRALDELAAVLAS